MQTIRNDSVCDYNQGPNILPLLLSILFFRSYFESYFQFTEFDLLDLIFNQLFSPFQHILH